VREAFAEEADGEGSVESTLLRDRDEVCDVTCLEFENRRWFMST